MYKEERYTVEEEMREIEECDVEEFFVHQNSSEKTIAMLGDRWWPQAAKPEGDKNRRKKCNVWKQSNERPTIRDVSTRNRNGAPSRNGCVVNG